MCMYRSKSKNKCQLEQEIKYNKIDVNAGVLKLEGKRYSCKTLLFQFERFVTHQQGHPHVSLLGLRLNIENLAHWDFL